MRLIVANSFQHSFQVVANSTSANGRSLEMVDLLLMKVVNVIA